MVSRIRAPNILKAKRFSNSLRLCGGDESLDGNTIALKFAIALSHSRKNSHVLIICIKISDLVELIGVHEYDTQHGIGYQQVPEP